MSTLCSREKLTKSVAALPEGDQDQRPVIATIHRI
jgi:hypothetical protein